MLITLQFPSTDMNLSSTSTADFTSDVMTIARDNTVFYVLLTICCVSICICFCILVCCILDAFVGDDHAPQQKPHIVTPQGQCDEDDAWQMSAVPAIKPRKPEAGIISVATSPDLVGEKDIATTPYLNEGVQLELEVERHRNNAGMDKRSASLSSSDSEVYVQAPSSYPTSGAVQKQTMDGHDSSSD